MAKRVQVRLLSNWTQAGNPDGPATFYRANSEESGALQVSLYARYTGGKVPNPSKKDLIELAEEHGKRHDAGEVIERLSGTCELGKYGAAVFRSDEFPRIQFWYLSNGRDFVLATHVCSVEPEPAEVEEAQQIVDILELSR